MKRTSGLWPLLVVVLAILSLGTLSSSSHAGIADWRGTKLSFDSAGVVLDRKAIGDENDSCRTTTIDLSDCDWEAFDATSTAKAGMRLILRVTTQNTATDTIPYQVEKGVTIGSTTTFNYRLKGIDQTPSIWNTATSEGDGAGLWFSGYLQIDSDTRSTDNIYLVPKIRIKFNGDQSGSSPKVIVQGWLFYPRRFYTK